MINIKSDSRKVLPGDIFIALRGISSDGHNYIEKAITNGASKIIAEEGEYNIPYEIVKDTREYLNNYLKENYNKYLDEMTIIGITGTNGKTTTAYLIWQMLNATGHKCGYSGTIGYYLQDKICSLSNTSPDICEIYDLLINAYENGYHHFVMETSSHALENGRIANIPFSYAIFTNLTQDHLDFHQTMENYAIAKQKLFKKIKKDGVSIINYDDEYKDYFKTNNTIYYGMNGGNYKITDYKMTNQFTQFKYIHNNEEIEINSPLLGDYNTYNLLSAIIVLDHLKISVDDIKKSITKLSCPPGRMDKIHYGTNNIIIDYAHTPDAISKIINATSKFSYNNIYVVFGCTGDRDRTKRPIMTKIVTDNCKKAIITIDDPHNEDPNQIVSDMLQNIIKNNYEICLDRKKAIERGIDLLEQNDILLILGKGHEEFIIFKDKNIPFNDKKIVIQYLKEHYKIEI